VSKFNFFYLICFLSQSECIPLILGGGDVMAAAETGSGKTGAFCLPLIQIVFETLRDLAAGKVRELNTLHLHSNTL
jgi:superfamily II DNA/RNA helicase